MKKLLILVDFIGPKKEVFAAAVARELGAKGGVMLARLSDLVFDLTGDTVKIDVNGYDISEFDLVYFRRSGFQFFSITGAAASVLKKLQIPFFDTTFEHMDPAGDNKLLALVRLHTEGAPIIPSFFAWRTKLAEYESHLVELFGYPFVAKEFGTQRGTGVHLIRNQKDFKKLLKHPEGEQFIIQKYVEGEHEYRLLVLKDNVRVYEEKVKSNPDEFRANVALGATEIFMPLSKMPKQMEKIAIHAAKALDLQIAGVDILVDTKGKQWLLEANRGPGLTYDESVSPELSEIGQFFARELKIRK